MTREFGLRLFLVSICNYLFGNTFFALMWVILNRHFAYWEIAIISTLPSSVFSFHTQTRLILRRQTESIVNFRYIIFQLLGLAIAISLVPVITDKVKLSVVVIQFGWSAFYSLTSLLLLQGNRFKNKTDSVSPSQRKSNL